ncbi:MAG: GNAT family N-acetyltransferase [Propionibacteriaceae bacterium]|nr:GNAT family N-acetyltransferase [Propionibacteriaceae bacterium]
MKVVHPPHFPSTHHWPVALRYDPVVLTGFRVGDRKEIAEVRARNQTWLNPWNATPPVENVESLSSWGYARFLANNARQGRSLPWVIRWVYPHHTPVIGQITLNSIMYGSAQSASLGYWMDQRYAGRGVMGLAVALVTDYAMTTMGLHRIEICIRPENSASLRVVEKLGLRHEGSRPRYIHIAGHWCDHEVFVITKEELGAGLLSRVKTSPGEVVSSR